MKRMTLPAIVPVRTPAETELAAAARSCPPLTLARALADWFGDSGVDAESGWRSARAQRDAAVALGLVSGEAAMTDEAVLTDEITNRLLWIYEIAFHAGYVHASDDHRALHGSEVVSGAADRTDAEIIADWYKALAALYAHGVEHVLPPGANPAPLVFDGLGNFPVFQLFAHHGTATTQVISAEIAEGAAEDLMPSYGRRLWTEWTARHGDPTAAYLRLAAELGVVTVDGSSVSLTPLGTWAVLQDAPVKTEELPAAADLTPSQVIICRLGMTDEAFERELSAWLAAREPAAAVTALLTAAAEEDPAYLTTGVRIAAGITGDTEDSWMSAMSLPSIRPYAVAELNRRAGRDPRRDPLPGIEPLACDAVVLASEAIIADYSLHGPDGLADSVRHAAGADPEAVLFEQMWRSRHRIAEQALAVIGKEHPDKKVAKAARTASAKAASARQRSNQLSRTHSGDSPSPGSSPR